MNRAPLLALALLGPTLTACGSPTPARSRGSSGSTASSTGTSGSSTSGATSSSGSTGGAGSSGSSGGTTGGSAASSSGGSSGSSGSTGATPGPVGCVTDVSAGHHLFACDGFVTYDVEVPAACAAGGCGLVLDIHGYTMNADQEDQGTGMRARAAGMHAVVIQPTAPGFVPSWNPSETFGPLVFAFAQDAAAAYATDPRKAHAMGFSQGGAMTWWMVCNHADFFASAAPLSAGGVTGCSFTGSQVPARQIPILQVHGRQDNVVSFDGTAVPQRDALLAAWGAGPGATLEEDAAHKATRYRTSAGADFQFWEHDYQAGNAILGGHCFPGGSDVGPFVNQYGCQDAPTFGVGALAAAFFAQ